jgi:Nucleotidyl transferase AbiEii toxin, Type IV TA system
VSYPVDDGPHNDVWKELLSPCFRVIDEVIRERNVEFPIRIGGGSMLLRRYKHRKSRDLDLFVTDAQLVRWCSPRFNETAADLFPDYGEEAAAVKLVTGMQEIDIIAAAPIILDRAVEEVELGGRKVFVELPREIVAKKVVYRGRNFQTRDVFDLACVAIAEPEEIAAVLLGLTFGHLDDLDARLKEIEPVLDKELADKVDAYPEFEPVVKSCLAIAQGVAKTWREALAPKVEVPPYPQQSHRAVFSRDGRTVVIKEWDAANSRFDKIGNVLGPAKVSPEGVSFMIGGVAMSEDEWKRHPDVVAAKKKADPNGLPPAAR